MYGRVGGLTICRERAAAGGRAGGVGVGDRMGGVDGRAGGMMNDGDDGDGAMMAGECGGDGRMGGRAGGGVVCVGGAAMVAYGRWATGANGRRAGGRAGGGRSGRAMGGWVVVVVVVDVMYGAVGGEYGGGRVVWCGRATARWAANDVDAMGDVMMVVA